MKRSLVTVALALALCATVGASLAPLFLKPEAKPCTYLSTPVQFTRVDSVAVETHRKTMRFPVVEYRYVVGGRSYTSGRMFCSAGGEATVNWQKVYHFFQDVRDGVQIVAWFPPSAPESACLSIDTEFSYSVQSNTSVQCRADRGVSPDAR